MQRLKKPELPRAGTGTVAKCGQCCTRYLQKHQEVPVLSPWHPPFLQKFCGDLRTHRPSKARRFNGFSHLKERNAAKSTRDRGVICPISPKSTFWNWVNIRDVLPLIEGDVGVVLPLPLKEVCGIFASVTDEGGFRAINKQIICVWSFTERETQNWVHQQPNLGVFLQVTHKPFCPCTRMRPDSQPLRHPAPAWSVCVPDHYVANSFQAFGCLHSEEHHPLRIGVSHPVPSPVHFPHCTPIEKNCICWFSGLFSGS